MGKLYFKYGTMNCSKSANLLMVAHNYTSNNMNILLLQSSINNRDGDSIISSRLGISKPCISFSPQDDIKECIKNNLKKNTELILIDEIQFCTEKQIQDIAYLVDELGINIICYGLKSSYTGELFPSIAKLLALADKIEEIKQTCTYCGRKAIMNLRLDNGVPVYNGNLIKVGDVENKTSEDATVYVAVCRKHFYEPKIRKEK